MIGLVSAMEEELTLFRRHLTGESTVKHCGLDFHFGRLEGREVAMVRCGVGKVNAAIATQLLVDRFNAESIVFTGLAGTLVPYLNRGDIVISSSVVQHDVDLSAFGRRVGELPDLARAVDADQRLVHAAAGVCERVIADDPERKMVVGTIASGDSFVADPEKIRWLQAEFGAVAVEMEGGAVGQVCRMSKIPFVVIRVISDGGGDGAAGEFIMFLDQASELSFRIVSSLISGQIETAPR
ncbi:MAG: 5'-methylthioadenosine/adenosylhomocysteine nucleosidase [candidate division Zixibacteria bacterium]|nr:5'-methylthioadenosine/adenosylhomocysteine nucleosidase [candidate division Zixibacteria bacterium]